MEIITVKEYAERAGISKNTTYKRIQAGQLKTIKKEDEHGKTILYIVTGEPDSQDGTDTSAAAAGDPRGPAPGTVSEMDTGSKEDPYKLLLAEKDKQIEQLQKQLEEMTELLRNSQKIQAGQLVLLTGKEPEDDTITVTQDAAPEPMKTQEEKRGFWHWLFG